MGKREIVPRHNPPPPVDDTPPFGNYTPLPHPSPRPKISLAQQNVLVTYSNGQRIPAIWGSNVQTGGLMMGPWIVGGKLIIDYIVCHGPIGAMGFTLDGKAPADLSGTLESNVYLGTAGQAVDPLLATVPGWTSALPGIAHVAVRFSPPTKSGVIVPSVQAFLAQVTQGLLVRDPRSGTDANGVPTAARAFSDNPALIWADFKTSVRYGAGYPDVDVNWDSTKTGISADVITAANDCDFNIGGGVKRYRMGWKLDPSQSLNPDDVENTIRQHFFGSVAFYNSKWNVWVNKAQSATSQVFQDHTGPGGTAGSNILSARWRQKGVSEIPTAVRINYVDSAANYQDGQAEDDDPGLTSGATSSVQYVLYEYTLGVPTYDQAKRLAIQYRNIGLLDKEYWVEVGPEGMLATPGCVVTVYSQQLNVSNQQMLVVDIAYSPASDTFVLHCLLYNAASYSDTAQTGSPAANTIPANPNSVPPDIANLRLNSNNDIYWEPPQALSYNHYGAVSWSAVNVGAFTAANVNDGSLASAAFNLNIAGDSTLTYDAGVGQAKAIVGLTVWYDLAGVGADWAAVVEYSDDMSTWTAVTNLTTLLSPNASRPALGGNPVDYGWVYAGAHRGWRIRKNSATAYAVNVLEVQLAESAGPVSFIDHYLVVDLRYTTPRVFASIAQADIPTAASGIGLQALTKVDPQGNKITNFKIVAYTTSNAPSPGISYSTSSTTAVGTVTSDSSIAIGQTAYNTGVGFWLGIVSGIAKLSLGSAGGNSLTFDGTNLSVTGSITATSGSIGGWTVNSTELVGPSGVAIRSGQTAFNTGTGFWLGNVGGTPKFSLGVASGAGLTWDGVGLNMNGAITATSGTIGGWTIGSSTISASGAILNSSGLISVAETGGYHFSWSGPNIGQLHATASNEITCDNLNFKAANFQPISTSGSYKDGFGNVLLGNRATKPAHADGTLASATTQLNALIDALSWGTSANFGLFT